ncbi:MAG TPA: MBL fold metallo-hydrolase [Propioniciclava tarda]|nr:MBL fold metallo-hydrolase [Propioniciclava tarda]
MEFSLGPFELVGDRVWRAVAEPASVNIGLVAGRDGCVVIDTGSTPAQGREIRDAAARVAGFPVVAAVVTHAHYDHAFGLAAFADLPTYAHASVWPTIEAEASDEELAHLGLKRTDLAAATHPFKLAAMVDLGDRHVEVVHFGPGHTPGDAVALVPDARVVFAGDLIENPAPYASSDSTLSGWPLALDGVLGTLRADSVIVGGHGDPVDRVFAVNQRGQLAGIYLQLEYLFQCGTSLAHVVAKGDWPFPDDHFAGAVARVHAELKAKGKIGRPLKVIH